MENRFLEDSRRILSSMAHEQQLFELQQNLETMRRRQSGVRSQLPIIPDEPLLRKRKKEVISADASNREKSAANKRARNTEAARRSRRKKYECLNDEINSLLENHLFIYECIIQFIQKTIMGLQHQQSLRQELSKLCASASPSPGGNADIQCAEKLNERLGATPHHLRHEIDPSQSPRVDQKNTSTAPVGCFREQPPETPSWLLDVCTSPVLPGAQKVLLIETTPEKTFSKHGFVRTLETYGMEKKAE